MVHGIGTDVTSYIGIHSVSRGGYFVVSPA